MTAKIARLMIQSMMALTVMALALTIAVSTATIAERTSPSLAVAYVVWNGAWVLGLAVFGVWLVRKGDQAI